VGVVVEAALKGKGWMILGLIWRGSESIRLIRTQFLTAVSLPENF